MIIMNFECINIPLVSRLNCVNLRCKCDNQKITNFLKKITYQEEALFLDYNNCQKPPDKERLLSSFVDLTGYECALNSVYLSDFTEKGIPVDIDLLNQYCSAVEHIKENLGVPKKLVFIIKIINEESLDMRVTFHLLRENEYYLKKDLDTYNEPIIIIISDK